MNAGDGGDLPSQNFTTAGPVSSSIGLEGDNFSLSGTVFGLGYEYGLNDHLSLRAEYDYISYDDNHTVTESGSSGSFSSFTSSSEFKNLHQNMLTLGLTYKL